MSWIDVALHPSRPLKWWLQEYRAGRMDMQPGYQRRANLWGRWKKAHLIDSIINGFDVPKFYVADFNRTSSDELRESPTVYAVIDGKQRFDALFSFLSDDLPLNPTATYLVDGSADIAGMKFSELQRFHPRIAQRLEEFSPVVMSVATNTRGMVEQLFVRLNSGVSINGAERRNAMPGPLPGIIRDVTVHKFFGERVRFSTDRMQEFNLAAKLLMFEFEGGFADTKARNLDVFVLAAEKATKEIVAELDKTNLETERRVVLELEYAAAQAPYRAAEDAVMDTLDRMTAIFESKDQLLRRQGVLPVYYWFVRTNPDVGVKFRQFLANFEPEVLKAVREARTSPDGADAELLAYYSALRTSNDKGSMVTRYNILARRFAGWLKRDSNKLTVVLPYLERQGTKVLAGA